MLSAPVSVAFRAFTSSFGEPATVSPAVWLAVAAALGLGLVAGADREADVVALADPDGLAGLAGADEADDDGAAVLRGAVLRAAELVRLGVGLAPPGAAVVRRGAAVVGLGAAVVGFGFAVVRVGAGAGAGDAGPTDGAAPEPNRKPTEDPGCGS